MTKNCSLNSDQSDPKDAPKNANIFGATFKCLMAIIFNILFFWACFLLTISNVQNASRRMCNLGFVLFVVSSFPRLRDHKPKLNRMPICFT